MKLHSDFAAAFCSGARLVGPGETAHEVSVEERGTLNLPSGRISLLYPGAAEAAEGFEQAVTPGRYPIEVSRVDDSLACVRVRLEAGVAVRWELAVRAGEDASTLSEHGFFGCSVGARAGLCIADAAARAELIREEAPAELITDALLGPGPVATCLKLEDGSEIALFETGGSGVFAAYWGWSATGRLVELVVDLEVLLRNDREEATVPAVGPVGAAVELPGRLAQAGRIVIAERGDRLLLRVEHTNGRLELRDFLQRRGDSRWPYVEYDFAMNTKTIRVVAFLGLRRWARVR